MLCDLGVERTIAELFLNVSKQKVFLILHFCITKTIEIYMRIFFPKAMAAAKIIKCEKCGSQMIKKGLMQSGNAKYERYVCDKCGNVTLKCIGL